MLENFCYHPSVYFQSSVLNKINIFFGCKLYFRFNERKYREALQKYARCLLKMRTLMPTMAGGRHPLPNLLVETGRLSKSQNWTILLDKTFFSFFPNPDSCVFGSFTIRPFSAVVVTDWQHFTLLNDSFRSYGYLHWFL